MKSIIKEMQFAIANSLQLEQDMPTELLDKLVQHSQEMGCYSLEFQKQEGPNNQEQVVQLVEPNMQGQGIQLEELDTQEQERDIQLAMVYIHILKNLEDKLVLVKKQEQSRMMEVS